MNTLKPTDKPGEYTAHKLLCVHCGSDKLQHSTTNRGHKGKDRWYKFCLNCNRFSRRYTVSPPQNRRIRLMEWREGACFDSVKHTNVSPASQDTQEVA